MKKGVSAEIIAVFLLAACCQAAPLPAGRPKEEATLKGHNDTVTGLAFSPNGKTLASVSEKDNTIRLWDVATGKCLAKIDLPSTQPGVRSVFVRGVAFRPDGKAVATCHNSGAIKLWDPATGKCMDTLHHPGGVWRIAFSPDSKCLASAGAFEARIWDLATGRPRSTFKADLPDWVLVLAYTPEGKAVLVRRSTDCKVLTLWDVAAGTNLSTCEGHEQSIGAAALSPDGKTLVSSGLDKTLRVWEAATGKKIARLGGENYDPLAFSPDGKILACAWNVDGKNTVGAIRLLALPGLTPLATIKGDIGLIERLAFSPDGRLLAAGCFDKTIKIWSLPASWPQ